MAKTCPESLTLLPLASCARAAAVGTSRTKETTCYNPSTSAAIPTKHPQLLHAYAIGVPVSYVPYLKSLVFLSPHLVHVAGLPIFGEQLAAENLLLEGSGVPHLEEPSECDRALTG